MNTKNALGWATEKLINCGIDSPNLDAEIILAFILQKNRTYLYTHPDYELTTTQFKNFKILIKRRCRFYPVAYLTGTKEFYGYKFIVNKNVLVPRPLSEELIDTARKIINFKNIKTVADIGTGSGCLAITLKKLFPQLTVYATDISKKALKVAKLNALEHQADISFIHGHLLAPLKNIKIDLLIANLPYLDFKTNGTDKYLRKEPKLALFAKKNGISYYEQTLHFLPKLISYPKYLLFEINEQQYKLIKPLFNNLSYQTKLTNKQIITAERKKV